MYSLLIEFRSPVCTASGGPGPGYVDRDVVFDTTGLPYIPAKRVKGLLRNALHDIASSLQLQNSTIDFAKAERQLFGNIGESISGKLRFRNALLCDSHTKQPDPGLSAWLASVLSSREADNSVHGILHREEVIHEFSEIRRQTRINRSKGVAAENTLRVTRSLRSGLAFRAAVNVSSQLSKDAEHLLALSAAALQQMGSSRTRGLGRVRCRFFRDAYDLTPDAIAALRADVMAGAEIVPQNPAPAQPQIGAANGPALLRFRLSLTQPALFANSEGDPNMIATLSYIPGSTLQGCLAWRFLAKHPPDEMFLNLFCRARLRFLPAYPEITGQDEVRPARSFPVPLSVQSRKRTKGSYCNLLAFNDWSETRRIPGCWTRPDLALYQGNLTQLEVAKELHYHHFRPSADRRIGRAVGVEQGKLYNLPEGQEGGVFTYEQIKPGASFIGVILGDRAALQYLRSLLGEKPEEVVVGRSRTGQYGGDGLWEWLDSSPIEETETTWSSVPEFLQGNQALVLALSPVLTVNANGHPIAEFPKEQLQAVSGLDISGVMETFARSGWASSYLTHQRLPRQQLSAIEPGSIFRLQLARAYTPSELKKAADRISAASFGLRTEQGYGRFTLLPATGLHQGDVALKYEAPRVPAAVCEKDSAGWKLAVRIYSRRVAESAISDALAVAADRANQIRSLTPGLLLRLTELVDANLNGIRRDLCLFRQRARSRIESCRIVREPLHPDKRFAPSRSLDEVILAISEQSVEHFRTLCFDCFNKQRWSEIFGAEDPLEHDDAVRIRITRLYLKTLLNGLAWRVREERRRVNSQGVPA